MSCDVECIVIGAGVIGLASARALSASGREVLVLERQAQAGTETSSRNSGVIHAGIYYQPGSAKARLCVKGKDLLYEFASTNGVPHRRAKKIIVATSPAQVPTLVDMKTRAEQNGVLDLQLLTTAQVAKLEPELSCEAALLSPSTGIIDSFELMNALQGHAQANNTAFAFNTHVHSISLRAGGGFTLSCSETGITDQEDTHQITCRSLIVAAGHFSSKLISTLAQADGNNAYTPPKTYFAKGNYFTLSGKAPFTHLIYPVPVSGGLGIHLTLDLANQARFGPDVQWLEGTDPSTFNYDVNPARAQSFYTAIQTYWPELPQGSLQPDFSGIRPKLTPQGQPPGDFQIHDASQHGHPDLIAIYGIESPGLTASLAIAEVICDRLDAEL